MQVVNRHWPAIVWDFQHVLGFSAYEYFQWVPFHKAPLWRRKRPLKEFVILVQLMADFEGTLTQESVLHDPDVVKWMAEQKERPGGKPRLWGYTREIAYMATLIDATVGKNVMKRPDIPGEKLREKNNQNKLRKTLSRIGVQ